MNLQVNLKLRWSSVFIGDTLIFWYDTESGNILSRLNYKAEFKSYGHIGLILNALFFTHERKHLSVRI